MTDEDVEKELEESRESINRFKAVNLMAEEEYVEQKQRFEFLTQQRQDLRDSIHSTEEAIRKIDEESKTQFLKALERGQQELPGPLHGPLQGRQRRSQAPRAGQPARERRRDHRPAAGQARPEPRRCSRAARSR
ncbi:MAG: hypothetical protein M0C28_45840 [Candidatus Moduliflexus flocculans]|nr:hypothetical protein [Candidatus Moduliflexus flocculans]